MGGALVFLMLVFAALALTPARSQPILCAQLRARSIGAGQPFQLPLSGAEDSEMLIALAEHLRAEPWELVVDLDARWLRVLPPQPYSQEKLESAFECN